MKISVIIPVYNVAPYIRACLDSVCAAVETLGMKLSEEAKAKGEGEQWRDSVSVEVICVDDGSTDESGAMLDDYQKKIDSAVRLRLSSSPISFKVLHQPNGGEGAARNSGLAVATGDWVAFLDSDDVWLSNMLTEFSEVVARQPDADIIGFRLAPFEEAMPPPEVREGEATERSYDTRRELASEVVLDAGICPTFFRRAKIKELLFTTLPLGADRLYVAECLARADRVVLSSVETYGYRIRKGSMARAVWNERKVRSLIDYATRTQAVFAQSGKRLGRRGRDYLGDVLFSVTPKQIRRMTGDRAAVRRYWREALVGLDVRALSIRRRLQHWWLTRVLV